MVDWLLLIGAIVLAYVVGWLAWRRLAGSLI
jgi:hypothetical protein